MSNTNSKNLDSCSSCNSCDYCNSCDSCYSCYSCDYCNSCDSCNSCYSCNSCNSCNSCDSCDSCYSCNYCNSCSYSFGLRMSEKMLFCLGEGQYESKGEGYQKNLRIFNVSVSEDEYTKALKAKPQFKLPIAKWVEKKDMTKEEKENWKSHTETGGFLKTLSYKNAWAEAWPTASQEFKAWVKGLPNFDADIFEKITGQKFGAEVSLKGKKVKVEIDGQSYSATLD